MDASAEQPAIVVLAGPTGVGKTRLAIELCLRTGGEIIGADSVQVYRGFDIGAGKPRAQELGGVAHHLLDVVEPNEPIDAARFAALADRAIAEVAARGRVPIVVGGTGLWLRALLRGLVEVPAVDAGLRARLEQEWHALGAEAMHRRLREIDPRTAAHVHSSDRVRVVRALEVHAQTGHALGDLRARHALGAPRHRALTIVLDMALSRWRPGIAERAHDMIARGFVDEVRGLIERYGPEIKPLRAVGYRQVALGLAAGANLEQIERDVVRATRLYGKRQRNWFRTDPSVDLRLDAAALLEPEALARIRDHLDSGG
jgi:tRNA dimethylallyltransferase